MFLKWLGQRFKAKRKGVQIDEYQVFRIFQNRYILQRYKGTFLRYILNKFQSAAHTLLLPRSWLGTKHFISIFITLELKTAYLGTSSKRYIDVLGEEPWVIIKKGKPAQHLTNPRSNQSHVLSLAHASHPLTLPNIAKKIVQFWSHCSRLTNSCATCTTPCVSYKQPAASP